MTSSSGSDDASGHSRRRRSPRSPEPADSSWADVVGVRGSWQDDDPGKNDPPGGFDAFGTRSAVAGGAAPAAGPAAGPGSSADAGPARSDRRSGRRDQASTQQPDVVPGATPASVNPDRPWWAGGGEGGPVRTSSPFQPGSAMSGMSGEMSGEAGEMSGAMPQADPPVQPQRPDPARQSAQPIGGSMFEPVRQEPRESPDLESPDLESADLESAVNQAPPEERGRGRRTGYDAAPYDPSGYERTEPAEERYRQAVPQPYEPPSYASPTHQPPAYEPAAYEPAAYEPAAYEPPAQHPPAYELPTYESPAGDAPTYQLPAYEPSGFERPGHEPGGFENPGYTPPVLEPPRFEHGELESPSPSVFAPPPARMPAPWDSPITGLPSLDEFTSALPVLPAAPVPPAPIIPAPIIPAPPSEHSTTSTDLPRRPVRRRRSGRADEPDDDRAVEARGHEPGPETAAEISAGITAEETAEPARAGQEKSFNDMLTGSIPRLGRGRQRSSGRLGSKAKSPGMPVAPPPAAPPGPAAASRPPGAPAGLDDDTTIFPGIGRPEDEPDATMIRPPLRDVPDQSRSAGGQVRPRPDRDDEVPVRPDDQSQNPLLPGVPGPAATTGRAGRNLPAAIAVGVGLGAMAVASLFTRPEAFVAVVSVVAVLAVWELAGAMAAKDIMVPVVPLAVGSLGMLVSAFVAGEEGLLVSFTLTGFGVLLWRIIDGVEGAARDITAGLFVAAYVPLLAGFAILMLADGPKYVVAFILVTVASDIGGYAAGVLAGKHPMAPTISPKKTWEGFAGSVVACLGVGVASVVLLLEGNPLVGLALGGATVVTATLGDLAESLLKRDLNVKDMGNLLPGHGGLMDRLDSLLPTAPVAFLILHMLVANS